MANILPDEVASPRCYSRHQRYRQFARVRTGAHQFAEFLEVQATRLTTTTSTIFTKLTKYTADRIRQATNISQIP